jgi:two-component system OmpR family sensor kinase
MLDSVRVRLTLWYTAVLAIFLVLFSLATYFMFWRSTVARTDSNLSELADAFLVTVRAELEGSTGPAAVQAAAREAIIEHRFRDHIFAVLDPAGNVLVSSQDLPTADRQDNQSAAGLVASDAFRQLARGSFRDDRVFATIKGSPSGHRGLANRFSIDDQPYTLVVLQSLHPQQEMLEEVWQTFAWAIPIAVILASVGGYFLARKSLAPVVAMSTQAGRMGAANLHERLPVQNEKDELGHLAFAFNSLLDRLDRSFERQQRFMADASHELRTPVAILRGEAEVALSRPVRAPDEYRESLAVLYGEAQRLTHIVEDLFTLTRADAGQYPLACRDFYLDELVSDCVRSARTLALPKKIALTVEAPTEFPIHADEALLRRMILNLLDNAIKYAPCGAAVHVSCRRQGHEYAITVTDTGPGIPTGLQTRIFERFFRADEARSRSDTEGGGAGLGLSIARWIAEAHQGRLVLIRSDSTGSVFTSFLPAPLPASG